MLSLGNFYFNCSNSGKNESQLKLKEKELKDSYKFFHHVLNENHNNAYAANGLGMVFAAMKEAEMARETFSMVCICM